MVVKKRVKKKAEVVKTKVMLKQNGKKMLKPVSAEVCFVLHDGRTLNSIYELIDELEVMQDDVYGEYLHEGVNDFANWVKDVFEEPLLAKEIEHSRKAIDAQRAVLKAVIRELRHQLKK